MKATFEVRARVIDVSSNTYNTYTTEIHTQVEAQNAVDAVNMVAASVRMDKPNADFIYISATATGGR